MSIPPSMQDFRCTNITNRSEWFPEVRATVQDTLLFDSGKLMSKLTSTEDKRCKVVVLKGMLCGFVIYGNTLHDKHKQIGITKSTKIDAFFIKEQFRGQECDTFLLEEMIKSAKRRNAEHVHISTHTRNCEAQEFFKNKGFTTIAEQLVLDIADSAAQPLLPTSAPRERAKIIQLSHIKKPSEEPEKGTITGNKRKRKEECERPAKRRKRETTSPIKLNQLTLKQKYIHLIQSGEKTVEGRINKGPISNFRIGERIRFYYFRDRFDDAVCDITDIKRFDSFREMLQKVGVKKCIPEAHDLEEAVRIYDSIPGYAQKAAAFGVVAIFLRVNELVRQEYANR